MFNYGTWCALNMSVAESSLKWWSGWGSGDLPLSFRALNRREAFYGLLEFIVPAPSPIYHSSDRVGLKLKQQLLLLFLYKLIVINVRKNKQYDKDIKIPSKLILQEKSTYNTKYPEYLQAIFFFICVPLRISHRFNMQIFFLEVT